MSSEDQPMPSGQCACGKVRFDISGTPLFRLRCHCTVCQRFNRAPFADVVVFRAADVALPAEGTVDFRAYKSPPNVQRGRCKACGQAVFERFETAFLPKLRFVPAALMNPDDLPEVGFDGFYERRVRDISGDTPRHKGFWASQWAFLRLWNAKRSGR
jgi:hypothetical protein